MQCEASYEILSWDGKREIFELHPTDITELAQRDANPCMLSRFQLFSREIIPPSKNWGWKTRQKVCAKPQLSDCTSIWILWYAKWFTFKWQKWKCAPTSTEKICKLCQRLITLFYNIIFENIFYLKPAVVRLQR